MKILKRTLVSLLQNKNSFENNSRYVNCVFSRLCCLSNYIYLKKDGHAQRNPVISISFIFFLEVLVKN